MKSAELLSSGVRSCRRRGAPFATAMACLVGAVGLTQPLGRFAEAAVLADVRDRGSVVCGVNTGLQGFATANSLGEYAGLDVDLCRAVASAVFNDPGKVDFVPVDSSERFTALNEGRFDILSRNTTWTLERNALYGEFVGVNYYDGQGFMVARSSGIRSALQLDNATVCVARNTTTELNAIDFFAVSNLRYRPVYFDNEKDLATAFEAGDCQSMTTDRSGLAAHRSRFARPASYSILPEVVSKEPLGPLVRTGDPQWTNVVRWSLNCMINAEELGITQATVDSAAAARTPASRRLLGLEDDLGQWIGLDAGWCANIVRQVGNYAESYDRHVGPDTALGLERGVNALWTNGGLIYAPPVR